MGKYDDIMYSERPVSAVHLPMGLRERAAQFAPFSALTGYEAMVEEAGRLTSERALLHEDMKEELDRKLCRLLERPGPVSILYFLPDERKAGGSYVRAEGRIKKISPEERLVIMERGQRIAIDSIMELELL